jgi:hypothetical protein
VVLQAFTSIVYQITQESWAFASIIVKYYLIAAAIYLYTEKGLTKENLKEKILSDARYVITGIFLAGTLMYLTNVQLSPINKLIGEGVAIVYLAYLFWVY